MLSSKFSRPVDSSSSSKPNCSDSDRRRHKSNHCSSCRQREGCPPFYIFLVLCFHLSFFFLIQHTVGRADGEATPTARLNFSTSQLLTYSKCSRPVEARPRTKPNRSDSDRRRHKTNRRPRSRQRTSLGRRNYRRRYHR